MKKWTDKLRENGIKPIFSSIRHPQSNIVEQIHRELGGFFRVFTQHAHKAWEKYTETITKVMNETRHDTTGYTPIELHFNKKLRRVWEKYLKIQNNDETPYERRLFLARERIHGHIKTTADKKNKNRIHKEYEIGEKILLKSLNVSSSEKEQVHKFFNIYEGPYAIKKKIVKDTYIIINNEGK